jgi:chromosome segregation ATPase
MMKTVDQLVSEWTEEERETLKELINECRERERKSLERAKTDEENVSKLNESLRSFLSSLYEIKERTEKLADDLLGIYLHFYNNEMASS